MADRCFLLIIGIEYVCLDSCPLGVDACLAPSLWALAVSVSDVSAASSVSACLCLNLCLSPSVSVCLCCDCTCLRLSFVLRDPPLAHLHYDVVRPCQSITTVPSPHTACASASCTAHSEDSDPPDSGPIHDSHPRVAALPSTKPKTQTARKGDPRELTHDITRAEKHWNDL